MCSRVTTFAGLFADSGGKSLQHLAKLKHSPDLGIWEGSYVDGRFDIEALQRITLATARRLHKAHVRKKGKRTAEKSAADRHRAAHPQDPPSTKPKAAEPKPAKAAKPKAAPAKAAPAKDAAAKAALSSAAPTGPASNMWKQNSCHVDAALEVLHAGGFLAQCPCSGRPEQPPASAAREAGAREAAAQKLHMAAHAWMHGRSTAAPPDALDVLRDDVRRCLARCSLPDRAPTHTADVEADLVEQMMGEPGSAIRNVERILASCPAPTHLRVRTVRACDECGPIGQPKDSRTAAVNVSTTVLASVVDRLAPRATMDKCNECAQPLSRVSVTSDAEQCLFLEWVGAADNATALPRAFTVQLRPGTAGAEIRYDLVAVCYSPPGHFFVERTDGNGWYQFDSFKTHSRHGTPVCVPDGLNKCLSMAVYRPRSPARHFSLRQTFPPLAAPHTAHAVLFTETDDAGGVARVGLALNRRDPTLRIATLVASNSGRPGGACRALNGDVVRGKLHAGHKTQEEDVVSNWLLTLSASPTVQSTEFARISTAFGLRDASGTDCATIQGVNYTTAAPRMYADAWCITGAHLSVKAPAAAAFDADQSYPTSLVFCAGPNARAPYRATPASSMRRTYSAQAHNDMTVLEAGAAWAVYAALHASAACGCDAVLIPFVSGGLYAGPHDRDTLRCLFVENIQLMLDGGFNHAPALGVHFRQVIVVFLPP
jgi:hypothetical protein